MQLTIAYYSVVVAQYLLVAGLKNLKTNASEELAFKWANRWVLSNFIGYKQTQYMFEKVYILLQIRIMRIDVVNVS